MPITLTVLVLPPPQTKRRARRQLQHALAEAQAAETDALAELTYLQY